MVKLRMAQTLSDAVKFVEQGRKYPLLCQGEDEVVNCHSDIRVGPDVVCDPAFLVTR